MKNRTLIFVTTIIYSVSLISCKGQINDSNKTGDRIQQKSELLDFNYGGYGDTCLAFIGGIIYETQGERRTPISGVQIISYKPLPIDRIEYTNNTGRFSMAFCKGTFSILIKKNGYQTIKLINYESDPDQFSRVEAVLRKGTGEIVFDVSKKNCEK